MTLPAQDIVERLLSNAEAHFRGVPLARRITGQQLSEAADTISRLTADNEALTKHVAFLRDALGTDRKSIWRDAKLSASTEDAVEAILGWSANAARKDALAAALNDMLLEYGDRYDSECRLKNASELDMIAKARAALGDRP